MRSSLEHEGAHIGSGHLVSSFTSFLRSRMHCGGGEASGPPLHLSVGILSVKKHCLIRSLMPVQHFNTVKRNRPCFLSQACDD